MLILTYHRICDLPFDPFSLCVKRAHFEEHLAALRSVATPASLRDLIRGVVGVAITFDDGYCDNLQIAKPLLERYDVPATAFVTTAPFGEDREFMWDELECLLLQPGVLPRFLDLAVGPDRIEADLENWATYSSEAAASHAHWRTRMTDDPTPRHTLFRRLHRALKYALPDESRKARSDLLAWSGQPSRVRENYRTMTADELRDLVRDGLIEVGAHTITHPVLSQLSKSAQLAEIQGSRTALERILDRRVDSFAYPFGTTDDYTSETIELLRNCGYGHACSAISSALEPHVDLLQLPRINITDMDGDAFIQRLRQFEPRMFE